MTTKILMPALSPTMTEGKINQWVVKIGDKVKAGDIIAEIETDKATMEVESVDEGTITHLIEINSEKSIPVNSVIALIDGEDNEIIENNLQNQDSVKKESINLNNLKHEKSFKNEENLDIDKKITASPFVKSFANNNSIELENIKGTGPKGRIIKRDIIKLQNREEANNILRDYKIIEPSSIRSIIAKKTSDTKKNVPHFYLSIETRVDNLINLRKKINKNSIEKVSFNDLLVKAVALAMRKNMNTNVSWIEGKIYQYSSIDISVAVALDEGLITPIIKDADKKGVIEISHETKKLILKAHENNLLPEEYIGGSISLSNLGMYGISNFSAIINPPQSLILSVGSITEVPVIENGLVTKGNVLKSTLSVDHRALDGAVAAKFLDNFNSIIEQPFEIWLQSNDLEVI